MNRWTEQVDVPVIWTVAVGQTPPQLCAWHGEPAEEMRVVRFYQEKIPTWLWVSTFSVGLVAAWALGLILGLPMALLASTLLNRKRPGIEAEAWPYCMRCLVLHRVCVTGVVAAVVGFVGILSGVLRLASEGLDTAVLVLTAGGYLLGITGLAGNRFSWRRLAGAQVSADRATLHVEAHGRFVADIRGRLAAQRASATA
jgi:hypothetical protein